MANKKLSELDSRASLSLSDLLAVGDPSTGYLYKITITDLKSLTGAGVVSFNGRYGSVVPVEGDYSLTQLSDVVITSPSNNQILQYNGSNWVNAASSFITLSSLSATSPLTYNSSTGAFGIQVANTSQSGYLSSTDWNTFNGKQAALGYTAANDSLVVHLAGTETITGAKTFTANTIINGGKLIVGTSTVDGYTVDILGDATGSFRVKPSSVGSASYFYVVEMNNGTQPFKINGGGTVNMFSATNVMINTIFNTGAERGAITVNASASGNANGLVLISGDVGTTSGAVLVVKNTGSTLSNVFDVRNSSDSSLFKVSNAGAITAASSITGSSIIKSGGTSSQFLKADGSVDSSTYLTTSAAASTYMPYSGATGNVNLGSYGFAAGSLTASASYISNTSAIFNSSSTLLSYAYQILAVPSGSTWSNGATFAANSNSQVLQFAGSQTIASGATVAASINVNRLEFTASGATVTVSQSGGGIRAIAGMQMLMQTGGTNNGTVTHGASMFVQGVYPSSAANITFTNYYGLLINSLDEWGGVTLTNRWGIYQAGSSDNNYFAGKVGIGTNSPTYLLDVNGTARFSSTVQMASGSQVMGAGLLKLGIASGNGGAALQLLGWQTARSNWQIDTAYIANGLCFTPSTAAGGTTFTTPTLTLLDNNVGIGITSPSATLHVVGSQIFDGTGVTIKRTGVLSSQSWNLGIDNSGLSFYDNTNTAYRLVIKSNGEIAAMGIYNNTTSFGASIGIYSDGTLYRSTSSLKYKKDVEDAWYGLSDVMKLRAVTYKSKNERDGDLRFGGLIAEEVDEAGLKEFVVYAEDETPDALQYGNMTSLAFKAIQDLKLEKDAEILDLKSQIESLKARLN